MSELYIGLMSGTSIDSIDAVLVDLSSHDPRVLNAHSHLIPEDIREQILSLCQAGDNEIERMGQLDMQLGNLFANAVRTLLSHADKTVEIKGIGSHGQTIRHCPGADNPFSLQIANPAVIALQTGITTIGDFRNADIAAGGQGAPMVPAFHQHVFGASGINRVIVNIGGIANITTLAADTSIPVTGFDTGPGNILMDSWMRAYFNEAYDEDGQLAHQGTCNKKLLDLLLNDGYFTQAPPKSTGREYFNLDWLSDYLEQLDETFEPANILATLNELTATTIANDIMKYAPDTTEVLICGGGAKNMTLLNNLMKLLGNCEVNTTAKYALDPDWVEAVAFAWLAKQCLSGETGNLPSVTGARHAVILGGIYKAPPA